MIDLVLKFCEAKFSEKSIDIQENIRKRSRSILNPVTINNTRDHSLESCSDTKMINRCLRTFVRSNS